MSWLGGRNETFVKKKIKWMGAIENIRIRQPISNLGLGLGLGLNNSKNDRKNEVKKGKMSLKKMIFGTLIKTPKSIQKTKIIENTETISISSNSTLKSVRTLAQETISTSADCDSTTISTSADCDSTATDHVCISNETKEMIIKSLECLRADHGKKSILKNGGLSNLCFDILDFFSNPVMKKTHFADPLVTGSYSLNDYYLLQIVRKVHDLATLRSDSSQESEVADDSRISIDSVDLDLASSETLPRHKNSVENFQLENRQQEDGKETLMQEIHSLEELLVKEDMEDRSFFLERCDGSDDDIPLATLLQNVNLRHSTNLSLVQNYSSSSIKNAVGKWNLGHSTNLSLVQNHSSSSIKNAVGKWNLSRKPNFILKKKDILLFRPEIERPENSHVNEDHSDSNSSRQSSIELFTVEPLIRTLFNPSIETTTLEKPGRDSITILSTYDDTTSFKQRSLDRKSRYKFPFTFFMYGRLQK